MDYRSPALQPVVPSSVKYVSCTDGNTRSGCFDCGKRCMIVHGVVAEKNFLSAAAAHVQCRKIVKRASRPCPSKEPSIRRIPKTMFNSQTWDQLRKIRLDHRRRWYFLCVNSAGRNK